MRFYILVLFVLYFKAVYSQVGTGEWRMHIAPKAIDVAAGDGLVFAALQTGLLEYDVEENESSIWTDVNSLSDINISCIYYDESSSSFFVGYKNGNVDRIKNNLITNIPAIKLAQIQGDKSISSFISKNNLIYIATGFGIVVIDITTNEVKDTYYPTNSMEKIQNIAFLDDSIYALTPSKLYKSSISNPILADPSQWMIDPRVPTQSTSFYQNLEASQGNLYLVLKNPDFRLDSVFQISTLGFINKVSFDFDLEIENFRKSSTSFLLTLSDVVIELDLSFNLIGVYNQVNNTLLQTKNAIKYKDKLYVADFDLGMLEFSPAGNKIIEMSSPPKNTFFALGGNKDVITVAGGIIQKAGIEYNGAGAYVLKDEEWTLFDGSNQGLWKDQYVWDISSVAINPLNTEEIAIGSYSQLPLSITSNEKTIGKIYDINNSNLEGNSADLVCISDLKYDSKGNLWMVNCFSNNPLKVLTKNKIWYDFDCGSSVKSKFSGKLVIDNNGNKWFSILDQGVIGYDDGGTIEDPSDDKYIQINDGENTGALPTKNVTALAVDFDNELWIGTSNGFAILYNSNNAFTANSGEYNTQRIKIDFEGNVEYLLGNTSITDIEIDGGNRKWIATANAGIFLLSANGLEVLETYTKENSPLISNNIVDMQFNYKTGELFIITDIGLVSYRTNSSLGDSKYEDVKVFPNPVKPNFEGVITIQGIKYDSDVKFTDVSGNLVFQTTSNGGTATWNGKNLKGEKVAAGVYLIWTSSNTEKGRKVGKVVILN